MTPSTQSVISVWAGGAAIIPVNKEASGSMSVRRLRLFSLHKTHSALLSLPASCACRCGLVGCLCMWWTDVSHLSPSCILTCGKNPKASWRALIWCAQTSKQTLSRCAARQIITPLHCLHDRVSMITFITSPFFCPPPPSRHGCFVLPPHRQRGQRWQTRGRENWFNVVFDRRMTNRKDKRVRDRNNSGTPRAETLRKVLTLFPEHISFVLCRSTSRGEWGSPAWSPREPSVLAAPNTSSLTK